MGADELRYVHEAFSTNWLSTTGPNVIAFEKRFAGLTSRHCAALNSGTAAIHLALKLLGVKQGDEVVVPTLTFVATCNPILYEGGVPVFIDSERRSWNLDPELLREFFLRRAARNKLPKAMIVVHIFGQSADMEPILDICRHYEVPLLEDAAEALGAKYRGRLAGTFSEVAAFSFNGNKMITCSGGGMLVSPRQDWVEKALYWATQAAEPGGRNYLHAEVGYNYRLSNVLAGIALGQLDLLDQRIEQRRGVAFRYRDAFADIPGIELMPQANYGLHTNWLSCFLIDHSEFGMSAAEVVRFLDASNVESRPVWKPMHTQMLYQRYECIGGEIAEDLNRRGICLPSSSNLSLEDQHFVIDRIREAHVRSHPRKTVSLGV